MRSLYQDAQDFTMPDRQVWSKPGAGSKRNTRIYDSTAQASVFSACNRFITDLFPTGQQWSKLTVSPFVDKGERRELETEYEIADNMTFALLNSSNFDTAVHEFLLDWMIGTAVLMPEQVGIDKPLMFTNVPPSKMSIEEGAFGVVTAVFYEMDVANRDIKDTWPDAQIDETLAKAIKDKPNEKTKFVCCAYRDEGKWYYVVYTEQRRYQLVERPTKYNRNPFIVSRFMRASGEVWGRGPVITALPDIKTLNKITEFTMRFGALKLAGVWAVSNDGAINTNNVRITPGAQITVARASGPNASIANIAPDGDMQLAVIERDPLIFRIKQMLFDQTLPDMKDPVRSATEIVERVKQLTKDGAAPVGRLYHELVVPLRQYILDLLFDLALIKRPIVIDGLKTKVQLLGPLAQQQNIVDVENLVRSMQILNAFGNQYVMLGINMEEAVDYIPEKLGVVTKLRTNKEQKKVMQQAAAQLAAAQVAPAGGGISQGTSIPVA